MSTGIDKQALYGDFRDSQKWQQNLHRKAAHKSLDIPDGELGNISTTTKTGIGALGAVGIAAAAGLPTAALCAAILFGLGRAAPAALPAAPAAAVPDTEYDVRFYDKDGKLIEVPHISRKK